MSIYDVYAEYLNESVIDDYKIAQTIANSEIYLQYKDAMLARAATYGEKILGTDLIDFGRGVDPEFSIRVSEIMEEMMPKIRKELFMEAFSIFDAEELKLWRAQKEIFESLGTIVVHLISRAMVLHMARNVGANVSALNNSIKEQGRGFGGYYGHDYLTGDKLLEKCRKTNLW